jgi:hypothetical protein
LRTVGLREARARAKAFFHSEASEDDLDLLIDLGDGVVHAAVSDEVEERLLVAFVQQVDATLLDMNKSRADFWANRLDVVDAWVANATDKVRQRVQGKLAAARAAFAEKYGAMPEELRELIRKMTPQFDETREEAIAECPACSSQCVAAGVVTADVDADFDRDGLAYTWSWAEFSPSTLFCQQCGLRLTTQAELAAAGVPHKWNLPELDAAAYLARDWGEDYG